MPLISLLPFDVSLPVLLHPFWEGGHQSYSKHSRSSHTLNSPRDIIMHSILISIPFLFILNIQFAFCHYHWAPRWHIHRTAYDKHQLIPEEIIVHSKLITVCKVRIAFSPMWTTLYLFPPDFSCYFIIKSLSSMTSLCKSSTSSLIITTLYSIIRGFKSPHYITQH